MDGDVFTLQSQHRYWLRTQVPGLFQALPNYVIACSVAVEKSDAFLYPYPLHENSYFLLKKFVGSSMVFSVDF